jgi:hypothetical protein
MPQVEYSLSQYGMDYPRMRPVFGVSLESLLTRDNCVVPIVVSQCIRAVDLYGLHVEGIYRLSGEKKHVERIKQIFDNGKRNLPPPEEPTLHESLILFDQILQL